GVVRLTSIPPPSLLLAFLSTEVPFLRRHYPASSVVRTSPPPHTARPGSRELPVDPDCDHRWGFPCCFWSLLPACRRQYPGRSDGTCSLVRSINIGLPSITSLDSHVSAVVNRRKAKFQF